MIADLNLIAAQGNYIKAFTTVCIPKPEARRDRFNPGDIGVDGEVISIIVGRDFERAHRQVELSPCV